MYCYFTLSTRTWDGRVRRTVRPEIGGLHRLEGSTHFKQYFLSKVDKALEVELDGLAHKVYRYVDDYLVIVQSTSFDQTREKVLERFSKNWLGLTFTFEVPQKNKLQFLNLCLTFKVDHVCWMYSPRTAKPRLDYRSGHSRLVKNSIAWACLRSALDKSCTPLMSTSFDCQVERLKEAGFPEG